MNVLMRMRVVKRRGLIARGRGWMAVVIVIGFSGKPRVTTGDATAHPIGRGVVSDAGAGSGGGSPVGGGRVLASLGVTGRERLGGEPIPRQGALVTRTGDGVGTDGVMVF